MKEDENRAPIGCAVLPQSGRAFGQLPFQQRQPSLQRVQPPLHSRLRAVAFLPLLQQLPNHLLGGQALLLPQLKQLDPGIHGHSFSPPFV